MHLFVYANSRGTIIEWLLGARRVCATFGFPCLRHTFHSEDKHMAIPDSVHVFMYVHMRARLHVHV